MKYEKPVVVMLADATSAIQGTEKGDIYFTDVGTPKLTMGAYEADE